MLQKYFFYEKTLWIIECVDAGAGLVNEHFDLRGARNLKTRSHFDKIGGMQISGGICWEHGCRTH